MRWSEPPPALSVRESRIEGASCVDRRRRWRSLSFGSLGVAHARSSANDTALRISSSTSAGSSPILRSSRVSGSEAMPCMLRRSSREESAVAAEEPHTCCHDFASLVAHIRPMRAARRDLVARVLQPGESWQPARGRRARLHPDVGSSNWSSTSCSSARERSRSSASLSAASITSETTARTFREISGFHVLSFVSSFSATASTGPILRQTAR
jgi:hypothetical protein